MDCLLKRESQTFTVLMNQLNSDAPYYKELANETTIFRHAYQNKLPLMLKGPTGCGKSRFVQSMAAELGRSLITVSCHDDTSATDLLGRYVVKGGDTLWQDGPLTRAIRTDSILYLDEVAEAREDVVVVIHPLTDFRREIYIDKTGESLKASDNFMLIVSFNPGYQKRIKELKPSTRQRFVAIGFDYPEPSIEAEIIANESGIDAAIAKKLSAVAQQIRRLDELGLAETVSTRLLVHAAQFIRAGLGPRQACNAAISQPLSDDPDIQQSINDLIALSF